MYKTKHALQSVKGHISNTLKPDGKSVMTIE